MTQIQKVIKYIAIAFAIFLTVNIISGVVLALYSLTSIYIGKDSDESISNDLQVIETNINDIEKLKIKLENTSLEIKESDVFRIQTNNSNIKYSEKDGEITLTEKDTGILKINKLSSKLIIYLPKNIEEIDEAEVKLGAGKLKIDSLNIQKLVLELGAGEVDIKNLVVKKEMKINGGAGKTQITESQINKLNADMGVGEFIFEGSLKDKNKIDAGVGAIKIKLTDDIENYRINVQKGIGNVKIAGKDISSDTEYGNGSNYIKIEGGIGSIDIK